MRWFQGQIIHKFREVPLYYINECFALHVIKKWCICKNAKVHDIHTLEWRAKLHVFAIRKYTNFPVAEQQILLHVLETLAVAADEDSNQPLTPRVPHHYQHQSFGLRSRQRAHSYPVSLRHRYSLSLSLSLSLSSAAWVALFSGVQDDVSLGSTVCTYILYHPKAWCCR